MKTVNIEHCVEYLQKDGELILFSQELLVTHKHVWGLLTFTKIDLAGTWLVRLSKRGRILQSLARDGLLLTAD